MKRIAFVISLLSISATKVWAQQDYFVFIQSDKQQPFYVRLNEKTWSSSAIGYLVLPRLGDSTYHLAIGFPRSQFPEREFVVSVNHKDHAYQLKQMEGQGWVLFDEQTLEIKKPLPGATANNIELGERKTGNFAVLMSSLVNDSSVMYKTLVKVDAPKSADPVSAKVDAAVAIKDKEEKKADTALTMADAARQPTEVTATKADSTKTDALKMAALTPAVDSAVTLKKDSATHKPAPDSLAQAKTTEQPARPAISKLHEREGEQGREYVYIDSSGNSVDTIPVLIAFDKEPAKRVEEKAVAVADTPKTKPVDSLKTDVAKSETVTTDSAAVASTKTEKLAAEHPKATDPPKAVDSTKMESATKTTGSPKTVDSTGAIAATKKAADPVPVKADSTAAPVNRGLILFNSDCVNFATEQDVDKLRIKMLAAKNTEDRIGVAKKVFKTKCFVTRYIKALSELFPDDEAKFNFFETAYPYVSDTTSFKGLVDLFSSDLYIARFKALVRM